jgi:hypothetical protein
VIDTYLARLGLPRPDAPSVAALFALHRAQVERIPYENIDIYLGEPPGIEPADTIARIARGPRHGAAGKSRRTLAGRAEWVSALTEVFGLDLRDVDVDRLWAKTLVDHEVYVARTAPA